MNDREYEIEFGRIDRTRLEVVDLHEPSDSLAYWLSQPAEKRWKAAEYLRQMAYGYDPATTRLQRVLEVIERP